MGRRRIYSDEERKERKRQYDIKYQIDRYHRDPEYKKYKIAYTMKMHNKNKLLVQNNDIIERK